MIFWLSCSAVFMFGIISFVLIKDKKEKINESLLKTTIKEILKLLNLIGIHKILIHNNNTKFSNLIRDYFRESYRDPILDDIFKLLPIKKIENNSIGHVLLKILERIKFEQCNSNKNLEEFFGEKEFPEFLLIYPILNELFITYKLQNSGIKFFCELPIYQFNYNFERTFYDRNIRNILKIHIKEKNTILPETILMIFNNTVNINELYKCDNITLYGYKYKFICAGINGFKETFLYTKEKFIIFDKNATIGFVMFKRLEF
ncbi:hypothetical protein H311_03205 [Anncaliia algerae PRA109]|nr:hypothetical protein H311_03205 [Anncaliia algerae PRA109]